MQTRWPGPAGRNRTVEERHITSQRQACEIAAEQLPAMLTHEYVEYGGTGAIEKRPVLRQMLDELRALPEIDYVITTGLDRLARKCARY